MITSEIYLNEIIEALKQSRAAVMVGAGFSKNAEKIIPGVGDFKAWNELADEFWKTLYPCKKENEKNYINTMRLAEEVEHSVGRNRLNQMIINNLPDEVYAPGEIHKRFVELPWSDVFTTNYDTLLERAASNIIGTRYKVVYTKQDLVGSGGVRRIVKLHGSFPSYLPFVITEEDFRRYPIDSAAFVNTVQQSLLENLFCMVGFSGDDPNFIKWIGWIRDNLGTSNSNPIYYISINEIDSVKVNFLSKKNILVLNLEELFPKENAREKLNKLLKRISKEIDNQKKENGWILEYKYEKTPNFKTSIVEKTAFLKQMTDTYPGYVVMPWKFRKIAENYYHTISILFNFEKESLSNRYIYIYELVRFAKVCGIPLNENLLKEFWEICYDLDLNNIMTDEKLSINEEKQTFILLELLRAARELGNFPLWNDIYDKIDKNSLKSEQKNFLLAEECRYHFSLYEVKALEETINSWEPSDDEHYWNIIKAYFEATVGKLDVARGRLTKNLVNIRKILSRDAMDVNASSLENINISLYNYIVQSKFEREQSYFRPQGMSKYNWYEENEMFILNIQIQDDRKSGRFVEDNFDLTKTVRTVYKSEGQYLGAEYWRFLEDTGHALKIGNAKINGAFYQTIDQLNAKYSYWCFVQCLISGDIDAVAKMFSRKTLSLTKQENIVLFAEQLLIILEQVGNVVSKDSFWQRSYYDQTAVIIPNIISRYCYRMSDDYLVRLLGVWKKILKSDSANLFGNKNVLNKAILENLSRDAVCDNIFDIYDMPIYLNCDPSYIDPIAYISLPVGDKLMLNQKGYEKLISPIRLIKNSLKNDLQRKDVWMDRLLSSEYIFGLVDKDKEMLIKDLEDDTDSRKQLILYQITKDNKYANKAIELLKDCLNCDKIGNALFGTSERIDNTYCILDEIYFNANVSGINLLLEGLVEFIGKTEDYFSDSQNDINSTREEYTRVVILMTYLLMSCVKNKVTINDALKNRIFSIIDKHYPNNVFKCIFENRDFTTYEVYALWKMNGEELFYLHYCLIAWTKSMVENKTNGYNKIVDIMTSRYMCDQVSNIKHIADIISYILEFVEIIDDKRNLLLCALGNAAEKTNINYEDLEQVAAEKARGRIASCRLALVMEKVGIVGESIDMWHRIQNDDAEFSQIRNIRI